MTKEYMHMILCELWIKNAGKKTESHFHHCESSEVSITFDPCPNWLKLKLCFNQ